MADLTQTAANVTVKATGSVSIVAGGEAITQGMPVYLNSADGKHYKTDVTTSAVTAAAVGIALTPCDADADYFVIAKTGASVDLGATLTVGETYVISASGAISPIGDLTTLDYVTILGVATAADKLVLDINATGTVKP